MDENGKKKEETLRKIAHRRGFLPLVHVLRSQFLIQGQSETDDNATPSDVLKWLVVSEDIEDQKASRLLSCSDTRTDGTRKDKYEKLRDLWIENQSSCFPHGELSKWVFKHASSDVVVVLRSATNIDYYRQWLKDLKETNAWSFNSDTEYILILDDFLTKDIFNYEKIGEPDTLPAFLSELERLSSSSLAEVTKRILWPQWESPVWNEKDLACYFAWLICHDLDAQAWIYMRPPHISYHYTPYPDSQTGVLICLGFLPKSEDLALRYLDTLGWGVANAFETTSLLLTKPDAEHLYIVGAYSEMQAKGALLNQIWNRNADLSYRLPRRQHSDVQTNRRHRHTYVPLACLFPYLSSANNLGLRWASFFEWDPVDDMLDRIGWAIGSGWPLVQERLKDEDYWEQTQEAITHFSKAAKVMHSLHRENKIELLGDILFAQSSKKSPVVITCRLEGGFKGDETITRPPKEEHDLLDKDAYNYVFVTFDTFMADLNPILKDGAKKVCDIRPDSYANFLDELYNEFVRAVTPKRIAKITQVLREHFERKLHPSLSHAEKFGELLIRHLIWVFLHETKPNSSFTCLAYFPSRIKPDIPSGGCLLAFNEVPSTTNLLLIDNYVSDYFLAKSLIASEFETDFPCALTNKGFERSLITSIKRAFHYAEKDAVLTLAFMDLDGLKSINDTTKEHILGTVVIRVFSEILAECLDDPNSPVNKLGREDYDVFFGRWGGDEFLVGIVKSIEKGSKDNAVQNEIKYIEEILFSQIVLVQNSLKWKCTSDIDKFFSGSLEHFRRQKRIEPYKDLEQPDPSLAKLKGIFGSSPPSFTAAIGSTKLRHTADKNDEHPVKIYEDLRSQVDKACYLAKQSKRGSVLYLQETKKDARGNIICFTNDKYQIELARIYDLLPEWGIHMSISGATDNEAYELVTCICDSFAGYYGKDVNVIAKIMPMPEILIGIYEQHERFRESVQNLLNTFAEQWKKRMRWTRKQPESECDVQVIVAAVDQNDFRSAVDNSWDLRNANTSDTRFPFRPGPVCFARQTSVTSKMG
jgi:GGDEF domain-containing protein